MNKILVLLLILIPQFVIAQEFDVDQFMAAHNLAPFDLNNMPDRQTFTNYRHVVLESDKLAFSDERQNTNQKTIKIAGIEYIGTDNGEWGGNLEVVIDGHRKELMQGNIVHLLPMEGKLYIIQGLAHLGMASGSISVVEDIKNPSTPTLITKLPDAPMLVYLDNTRPEYQRVIIVGSKSVMELDPYMTPSILYWDAFWHINLEPTSIVRFDNNYFIGLPHGVAVVPAPWGESSKYCREFFPDSVEKHCLKVQFYADPEFNNRLN